MYSSHQTLEADIKHEGLIPQPYPELRILMLAIELAFFLIVADRFLFAEVLADTYYFPPIFHMGKENI